MDASHSRTFAERVQDETCRADRDGVCDVVAPRVVSCDGGRLLRPKHVQRNHCHPILSPKGRTAARVNHAERCRRTTGANLG